MKDIIQLRRWFQSSFDHPGWRNWRSKAPEDQDFYDGIQLSKQDEAELEARGQMPVAINKIFAKMNNLIGAQILLRSNIGTRGRTAEDIKVGEAITDIFRHISYRSSLPDEESDCFESGIIKGIGWLEAFVSEDEMGQAEIRIEAEDSFHMRLDPFSRRHNLSDAKFVSRYKWLDVDDAMELIPEKKNELAAYATSAEIDDMNVAIHGPLDDYDMKPGSVNYVDTSRRRIRLVEMWYREHASVYWMVDKRGNRTYIESLDDLRDDPDIPDNEIMAEFGVIKRRQKVVRVAMFTGHLKLSDNLTPHTNPLNINIFPFFPFFAFRRRSGEPYGYVRQMKAAQREINKRRSKAMHILNSAVIIMDEGAVKPEEIENFREEAARPDAILIKRKGYEVNIIKDKEMAMAQFNIMNQSAADLQDISGQFDEALGKQTNARSGVAIEKRKRSTNQNNIKVFNNFRKTRLAYGKFMLGLIKTHYTEEQVLNITDDNDASKLVQLNTNDGNGNITNNVALSLVDVIVEELPATINAQEEQFVQLTELVKSGFPLPATAIIQASSLRNKAEIIKMMQPSKTETKPKDELPN